MSDDILRIIYLEAENVKRLRAVRIRPDKTLVRIEGRNAQGKSSVLDAISAALGGGPWQPERPVRDGERRASVKLDLGELIVERRWTASGNSTLEVTAKNGGLLRTPQALLDKLLGDLTFDPIAFVRIKPAEQNAILMRAAGLDFSDIDTAREEAYAERTLVNRELKRLESSLGPPPPSNAPERPVDISELVARHSEAVKHNSKLDALQRTKDQADRDITGARRQAESHKNDLSNTIKEMEAKLAQLRASLANVDVSLAKEVSGYESAASKAQAELAATSRIDVDKLAAEMKNAETVNRLVKQRADWTSGRSALKAKESESEALTKRIDDLDSQKRRLLADAKFPIAGLSIDATGPTYNGVPFSQASSAEQLRVSVAIGLASKPRARIMLCRDGSLLDDANLQALHAIAEEYDAQVFVERVAESASPSAVYIEDGEVQEPRPGATASEDER